MQKVKRFDWSEIYSAFQQGGAIFNLTQIKISDGWKFNMSALPMFCQLNNRQTDTQQFDIEWTALSIPHSLVFIHVK